MPAAEDSNKIRRSRNGCNECRRLHRRCGEEKPACKTCSSEGRVCSYNRPLAWVGSRRERSKALRQHDDPQGLNASAVELCDDASRTADNDFLKQLPGVPDALVWLPWLSVRHRALIGHFAHVTCSLCFLDTKSHHDLCSAIVPLAVDTNSGFHLIAAMLCVAFTHRRSLGVELDDTEATYWEAMAVGHLRRQRLGKDETSENIFAATALLLSMRDMFTGGQREKSWRMHLDGALSILKSPTAEESQARTQVRRIATAMQQIGVIFSRHTPQREVVTCDSLCHFETCNRIDEIMGFSIALHHTLLDVEKIATDMTVLLHLERNSPSGSLSMDTLWQSLWQRVSHVVEQNNTVIEELSKVTSKDTAAGSEQEERLLLNQAYYYITLSQVRLYLQGVSTHFEDIQVNLQNAMLCLQRIQFRGHASPAMALLQPAFAIGCFACSEALRQQVLDLLTKLKKLMGKENAQTAKDFLIEFWRRKDEEPTVARPIMLDWRFSFGVPHRGEEYEWTDLMAEKDWDLCLW